MDREKPPSLEKLGNDVARYLKEKQLKENKVNDLVIATIRTVVPSFVGMFVLMMADRGVQLDEVAVSGLGAFLVGLLTAIYYVAVRLLGTKFPQAELLLGASKTPTYTENK